MSRKKTENLPELGALLAPRDPLMQVVEQAVLRGTDWPRVSAPVADHIAARLAGVITLGHAYPGQRLLEQDISEVLNVSRAPVREALRILEKDRLVEFQPRRGATVTAENAEELNDIFLVRSLLFDQLLRQIMADCPEQLQALLERYIPILEDARAASGEAYSVQSFLLNLEIADLSRSRIINDMLKSVALRTLRYVRLGRVTFPDTLSVSMHNWQKLLAAVRARDTDKVLKLAGDQIRKVRDVAVRALEERTGAPATGAPATTAAPAPVRARSSAPAPKPPGKPSRRSSRARA